MEEESNLEQKSSGKKKGKKEPKERRSSNKWTEVKTERDSGLRIMLWDLYGTIKWRNRMETFESTIISVQCKVKPSEWWSIGCLTIDHHSDDQVHNKHNVIFYIVFYHHRMKLKFTHFPYGGSGLDPNVPSVSYISIP